MKQFLSKMITNPVARGTMMRRNVCIIIMIGLASLLAAAGYLALHHSAVPALSSLLSGFAPVIGLCALLVVVSLLISFFVCTVERTLIDEDNGIVPEPHLKCKWRHGAHFLPNQLSDRLSLKEHSPPALRFS